ncbi:MAG: biotin--[acetyl-CoA-carboxylase] ligase [Chloroflexi bacterium]|nr:biotin--[acetyl-CoA-carboxylase] ligase [Chloroflexota bacterium]MBV6437854.1 Bifunctional ligase/repressor BirA [Anaerolineae bacterium]MDL1915539.1 biotin--[acetyl-CoA-carboxylase] ligase [Anaerolineae bacterium CFX4]OQY82316.1 MAG: biotin--[acetyl-CoA-carboxylase] ligase [Anaerolineae bacterium UTCFX5]MBW7880224.1 biotin--[acetyl-CoA-carboxylase] ligase [Anaerolineae bacterium]
MTFTASIVAATLGERPYKYFESVPSTMDAAREWLLEGALSGSMVIADQQTAGRGRMGRVWVAPDRCALAMSVVMRVKVHWLSQVAMLGGLVVADALVKIGVSDVRLKWPNDVLIGRRKVAGILAESEWDGSNLRGAILGIGVNFAGDFATSELNAQAVSITSALGHEPDPAAFFAHLIAAYDARTSQLGTPALFETWRSKLWTIGQKVRVESSPPVDGIAEDVSPLGALMVRSVDGRLHTVMAADVKVWPVEGTT